MDVESEVEQITTRLKTFEREMVWLMILYYDNVGFEEASLVIGIGE
jgi:hypothetical protein